MLQKIPKLLIASSSFLILSLLSWLAHVSLGGGQCVPMQGMDGCQMNDTFFMLISMVSLMIALILGLAFVIQLTILSFVKK